MYLEPSLAVLLLNLHEKGDRGDWKSVQLGGYLVDALMDVLICMMTDGKERVQRLVVEGSVLGPYL